MFSELKLSMERLERSQSLSSYNRPEPKKTVSLLTISASFFSWNICQSGLFFAAHDFIVLHFLWVFYSCGTQYWLWVADASFWHSFGKNSEGAERFSYVRARSPWLFRELIVIENTSKTCVMFQAKRRLPWKNKLQRCACLCLLVPSLQPLWMDRAHPVLLLQLLPRSKVVGPVSFSLVSFVFFFSQKRSFAVTMQ